MKRSLFLITLITLALVLTACPKQQPDTKDTKAPTVAITSIATSTTATYILKGTATDDVGVSKVQYVIGDAARQDLTLDNGAFSKEITLSAGANAITVYASDEAGNEGKAEKTVTFSTAPAPAVGTEFSQSSAEALNTAVKAIMTKDYQQAIKFATRYVPSFLTDISGVNAQSLARQTAFNGCPAMTSTPAGMLVDFDVPACTFTRNGISVQGSGKAVLGRTATAFTITSTTPVKVRASKGQEFFEMTLQGQFSFGRTDNTINVASKSELSFAANSQQTGAYSYTLKADVQGNLSAVQGQDVDTSGMDITAAGTFALTNNTNNASHTLALTTPTPFQIRMACQQGPVAGKLNYVIDSNDTFELSYLECGSYQITHNGNVIPN